MSASNVTGFNATHDAVFREYFSNFSISALNSLRDGLPSALNLTRDCLATANVGFLLNSTLQWHDDQTGLAKAVARSLRPALPEQYANLSLGAFDLTEYALRLSNLPWSFDVLRSTLLDICVQRRAQLSPHDPVDFTRHCGATNQYWWQYVYGKRDPSDAVNSFRSLLRRSLPDALEDLTDQTLTLGFGLDPDTVNRMVTAAAVKCKAEACRDLNYMGNPDSGGIGVGLA